jgi:LuxR family maltose regulon positive regulatory protein
VERGQDASDRDEWRRIRRWLDRLPRDVVLDDARLLVLEAWQLQAGQVDPAGVMADITRAAALLDTGQIEPAARDEVEGSVAALQTYVAVAMGDSRSAIAHAERALQLLPLEPVRPAAFAKMMEIMSLQAAGDLGAAVAYADETMTDDRFRATKHQPWPFALSCISLLEADRRALLRHGRKLHDLGIREGYRDARLHGGYFTGVACYLGDDLAGAQAHLEPVVADRYIGRPLVCLNAMIQAVLAMQARGRDHEATAAAEIASDYVLDYASPQLQRFSATFGALFAMRDGRVAEAARWARDYEPGAPMLEYHLFSPSLAHVEVLLAAGTEPDIDRAIGLLDAYQAFAERTHNRLHLINVLSLRALARTARGDEAGALEALGRAVTLSQPGEAIRAVADRGPGLVPLLNRLELEGEELAHVAAILAAIAGPDGAEAAAAGSVGVASPGGLPVLTSRELDVLALLERRYSNKEIAQELFVAPETVKKYTISLYEKLNVKGRHEAAAKGRALGYLTDD